MKKSVLMMSMAAAILALTGCAANKGAQQTQEAAPATAAQEQAPAAVPAEKLDGALCLFVDAHPQAKPYNDAVQQGVASLMPDVQTFSDPKAAPEVCQKGYIMAYGIKGKEVTDGAKTVKGKDGKPVKSKKAGQKHVVPESIMFAVFHDNKNVLHGEGPLKLQNNQIDLNQVSAYSQEMTNALLAKYKDGTLGKEEAPAAGAAGAAAPATDAATPAPATK